MILSIFIALCSILSLFRNVEIRYLKMLDFPRIQFFILSIISVIFVSFLLHEKKWYYTTTLIALVIGLLINGKFLINYTPFVSPTVASVSTINNSDDVIGVLLTNVKMKNRNSKPIQKLLQQKNPDIILAMEVDSWWNNQLDFLKKEYPYSQKAINDVAYGMVLYSKFPIQNIEIDYLNNKNVPSFESIITLQNGKNVVFHAMHPVPPTHYKDLPDNAGQQEKALVKMGNKIVDYKFPTIVAGDLNDPVWSKVDALTETENILFDVRVGRGFYNSFNAESMFMKWPLDHVFVTKEFKLKKLERLSDIGSDHYPIYVELVLN